MPYLLSIGIVCVVRPVIAICASVLTIVFSEAAKARVNAIGKHLKAGNVRAGALSLLLLFGCASALRVIAVLTREPPVPAEPSSSVAPDPPRAPVSQIPVNVPSVPIHGPPDPPPFLVPPPPEPEDAPLQMLRSPPRMSPPRSEPIPPERPPSSQLAAEMRDERRCSGGNAKRCRDAAGRLFAGGSGICTDPALAYGEYESSCERFDDDESCGELARGVLAGSTSSSWESCPPVVIPAHEGVWRAIVTIEVHGLHVADGVLLEALGQIECTVVTSLSALRGEDHADVHFSDDTVLTFNVVGRSFASDAALLHATVPLDRQGLRARPWPGGIRPNDRFRLLVQERPNSPGTLLSLVDVQVTTIDVRDLADRPVTALKVMSRLPLVLGAILLNQEDEVVALVGMACTPEETTCARRYVAFPSWLIRSDEEDTK